MRNNNPQGRGKGNLNKLTKETKAELKASVEPYLKNIGKDLRGCSFEARAKLIVKILPILMNGTDEVTEELRKDLFKQLLPEFRKIHFYLQHLQNEEKVKSIMSILKTFAPQQKREAVEIFKTSQH